MNCTDVSSGNSRARSSARARDLRQITGEGQRERRGIVHVAAPSKLERLAGALPGGCRIPVKRFPHGSARFEQAGPFASTRPLRDLDGDRGHPPRVLQAAGASQGERLDMRDDVLRRRGSSWPASPIRPSSSSVPFRNATKYWIKSNSARFQLPLRRPTDRQQRVIQAIQEELIVWPC